MASRRNVLQLAAGTAAIAVSGCAMPTDSTDRETGRPAEPTSSERGGSDAPATGSEATVDDLYVANATDEQHRVALVVSPAAETTDVGGEAESGGEFADEFTLQPFGDEDGRKTYAHVTEMDEACTVEVTVDGERGANHEWNGDVEDHKGLQIHVDYGEIEFAEKVA